MNGNQYIWILNGISLMLISGAVADDLENVALGKSAYLSSVVGTATANLVVDGNKDPKFAHGSCCLTTTQSNPMWWVDLENMYRISAVTITNRNDYADMLDGAEIWIGISHEKNTEFRCGVVSHIPGGQTVFFPCSGVEGRRIIVRLPGSGKTLSLCEVEVFPVSYAHPFANVALRGTATQSSTLSFANAGKAIDGRRNSFYTAGSCSHTAEDETEPWWRVDLGDVYIVTTVKITNRGDCCAERLDGAEVRIGSSLENNGNSNPRCASISHIRAGKTYTVHCDNGSMEGRFVSVIIPGEGKTLTLCEVEVYATLPVEPLQNVALHKQATQSSTYYGTYPGYARKAVDGCRSGYGCCSSTYPSYYYYPWWTVYLHALYKIRAVTITGRQDCCTENLEQTLVEIRSSSNYYQSCGTVKDTTVKKTHTFDCGDKTSSQVRLYGRKLNKKLELCEVEVFASLAEPTVATPSPSTVSPPPPPLSTFSVILGGRNVTVVGAAYGWSSALLYCRRHHWDLLSLQSQEEQDGLAELLGHSPFSLTRRVWLGLRRSIWQRNWFWMSGDAMTFTHWPRGFPPPIYSNPCGGMDREGQHLWEERPCQEPLNFICQSDPKTGAQRVYFYSTQSLPV